MLCSCIARDRVMNRGYHRPLRQVLCNPLKERRGSVRSIRYGSLPVSHAGLLSKRAVVLQAADITDCVWTCMRQKATYLSNIIEDTCFTSIDSARRKTYPILFF